MHKVLFVDDEKSILDGLRRMLRFYRKQWDMHFVDSGVEALKLFETIEFDVIVSDMRMPNMDGATLLRKVGEISPDTVRIALSGYAEAEMVLESLHVTHQFIAKPANAEIISKTVEKALDTRNWLNQEEVKRVLGSIENLPVLPNIYDDLMQEVASEEGSIKRVAEIVSSDMALSAVVLKVVNSAFFGLVRHIESPEQAATVLGMDTIKNIALLTCVFSSFEGKKELQNEITRINYRSQKIGILAYKLAKCSPMIARAQDHTQIAGMMSGLGEIIVKSYAVEFSEERFPENDIPLVGSYLLSIWSLPFAVIEAVRWHQKPAASGIDGVIPLTAVHAAWSMLNAFESTGEVSLDDVFADSAYLEQVLGKGAMQSWVEIGTEFLGNISDDD